MLYVAAGCFIAYKTRIGESRRSRLLWKPVIFSGFLFPAILLSLFFAFPQTLFNALSWIAYSLVLSYVISIEVPGYLMLSKYDDSHVKNLKALRRNLMKTGYEFDSLEDLKSSIKKNSIILAEEHVEDLMVDFVFFCERMSNLDKPLWKLVLNEITQVIERLSQRSKHPSPKLIDILSLAGLSFLMAQILKMFAIV